MINRWLGARCRNSVNNALESLQSYTKRSIFHYAIKTHLSCSFPVSCTALRILLDPIGLILSSEIAHATVSPMPITRGNYGVTQSSNGRPVIQASRLHVNHCNTEYKSQYNKQNKNICNCFSHIFFFQNTRDYLHYWWGFGCFRLCCQKCDCWNLLVICASPFQFKCGYGGYHCDFFIRE